MSQVVFILGEERFLALRALDALLKRHPGLETTRYDGSETSVAQVLDEVRTPTLLGGRRAVVVTNAGALFDGENLEALAKYAASPASGTLLVLQAAKADGRLKGVKALKAAAQVIDCPGLPPWKVEEWIPGWARSAHDLQVGPGAAKALRQLVGEDLGLLDAALARLKAQIAPSTRLEADAIIGSTEPQRSPALFEASSALEGADLAGALKAVRACFDDGIRFKDGSLTDERGIGPIVLTNLHKKYVQLLRFHALRADGLAREEAARKVGVSPQAARFFLQRVAHHDLATLESRHDRFLEADRGLKSDGKGRRVLEGLLLSLLAR